MEKPLEGTLEVIGAVCHFEEEQSDLLAPVYVAGGYITRLPVGPRGDISRPSPLCG